VPDVQFLFHADNIPDGKNIQEYGE
jgi:hypothetical protein